MFHTNIEAQAKAKQIAAKQDVGRDSIGVPCVLAGTMRPIGEPRYAKDKSLYYSRYLFPVLTSPDGLGGGLPCADVIVDLDDETATVRARV